MPDAPAKRPGRRRTPRTASTADKQAAVAADEATEEPKSVETDVERRLKFRHPGFFRMRTDWSADEIVVLARAKEIISKRLKHTFHDAYRIMFDLYSIVREPEVDGEGVARLEDGIPVWKRDPLTNDYIEDFQRLTTKQREDFLLRITGRLFAWEQAAAEIWGEAMFSKAIFEENNSTGYDEADLTGKRDRIEDRTAAASRSSSEDRYYAVMLSQLSRQADAIVRTMSLLAQRLKDVLE